MEENWKSIEHFENHYEISNYGRVRSYKNNKHGFLKEPKILKNKKDGLGYLYITLCKDLKRKNYLIHRLVAQSFIPNPENKATVNHIDGNKSNNFVNNLEWNTYSENGKHAYLNKLKIAKYKKIAQYDLNYKLIKIHNGYKEASKYSGLSITRICYCCNNNTKTKRYIWKKIN